MNNCRLYVPLGMFPKGLIVYHFQLHCPEDLRSEKEECFFFSVWFQGQYVNFSMSSVVTEVVSSPKNGN